MTNRIEKATFLVGLTCLTRGWFAHRADGESIGHGTQWRFWYGNDIGARARNWLGDGRALQRTPVERASELTAEATESRIDELLFEATFLWNGCVARADALRRTKYGWDLIEVKASKSPKDDAEVDDKYIDDIAYTHCIANGAGLAIERALLVVINREYRLEGGDELFTTLDVTERVVERSAEFSALAATLSSSVLGNVKPTPELKLVCGKCEFYAESCLGVGIDDPLFILPLLKEKRFQELKPFERISRLPADASLTDNQQRVATVIQSGEPFVDRGELAILDAVQWPVHYLDFETVSPPVPWFEGAAPYESVPFQFSVHRRETPDGGHSHREYLAPFDGDWRREMTEQLIDAVRGDGSIVVYSSFEKVQLKALAERFPDLAVPIGTIIERLFDLEPVFRKGYIHPEFRGKSSIKKVLPVMVKDPALSYAGLPLNNGDDAQGLFSLIRVGEIGGGDAEQHRGEMLEYCKLDTRAMVELHAAARALLK